VFLLFACVNLFVCDLAIGESVDETVHAFQTAPFGFAVHLIKAHLAFNDPVGFKFAVVTPSIGFTGIFHEDGTLTRSTIHQSLVLIALGLPDIVSMGLSSALPNLVNVVACSPLACVFGSKVLVERSICEATSPTTTPCPSAFWSMDVPSAKGNGNS